MANAMMKKGYIDEAVKASIFKREEISTTEMGGLIAIPHAMLNDIERFAVSIICLLYTSRALGASKHNIRSVFNAETLIVGFAAGMLGVFVTALL